MRGGRQAAQCRCVIPGARGRGPPRSGECSAEALGKLGDAQAVEPLCKALADADHHVRKSAAEALVKVGDARAVEPLCMALCDAYTLVRVYAAEALGRIGDTRAVIPLRKALGDKDVWSAATQALDKISGLQSASWLYFSRGRSPTPK